VSFVHLIILLVRRDIVSPLIGEIRLCTGLRIGRLGFDSRGAGNFYLHHRVENGSGAHPPSYPMGTRGYFPGRGGENNSQPPPGIEP